MNLLAPVLLASSAAVIFLLGALHLFYTFHGTGFHPREADLRARLELAPLVMTRETTMWKAWIGFNASHSCGALLFGAIYGYLALMHSGFLFQSWFLLAVGLLLLVAYVYLGKRYWFSVPFRGILLAAVLYAGALVVAAA